MRRPATCPACHHSSGPEATSLRSGAEATVPADAMDPMAMRPEEAGGAGPSVWLSPGVARPAATSRDVLCWKQISGCSQCSQCSRCSQCKACHSGTPLRCSHPSRSQRMLRLGTSSFLLETQVGPPVPQRLDRTSFHGQLMRFDDFRGRRSGLGSRVDVGLASTHPCGWGHAPHPLPKPGLCHSTGNRS